MGSPFLPPAGEEPVEVDDEGDEPSQAGGNVGGGGSFAPSQKPTHAPAPARIQTAQLMPLSTKLRWDRAIARKVRFLFVRISFFV